MPIYEYDGKHYELPEGLSNEQAVAEIESHLGKAPEASTADSAKRAYGIGMRALIQGLSSPANIVADGVAGGVNVVSNLLGSDFRAPYLSQIQAQGLDQRQYEGKPVYPRPETTGEKAAAGGIQGITGALATGGFTPAAAGANPMSVDTAAKLSATTVGGASFQPVRDAIKDVTGSDLAATGGALGLSALLGGAAGSIANKATNTAPRLTMEEVRQRAQDAYQTVNNSPVSIRPASAQRIVGTLRADLASEGFRPRLHPQVDAVLETMAEDIGNQRVSFSQLEQLRRVANELKTNTDPNVRRYGSILIRSFDDQVSRLDRPDLMRLPGSTPQAFDEALQAVQSARKDWRAAARASTLEQVLDVAELNSRKPTVSEAESIRNGFIALAKSPRKMAQFSPEEQQAIRAVSEGSPVDKVLGQLARLSPTHTAPALGYGGALAGAGAFSSPKTAAVAGATGLVGFAADKAQQLRRSAQARDVISGILNGQQRVAPEDMEMLRGLFGGVSNMPGQQ